MTTTTTSMNTVIPVNTPGTPKSFSSAAMMKPDIIAPARLAEYAMPLARERTSVGNSSHWYA